LKTEHLSLFASDGQNRARRRRDNSSSDAAQEELGDARPSVRADEAKAFPEALEKSEAKRIRRTRAIDVTLSQSPDVKLRVQSARP
jgi:hypothetical protein